VNRFMGDDAASGRATLAGCAHGAEQNCAHSEVHVRVERR